MLKRESEKSYTRAGMRRLPKMGDA